MEVSNKKNQKRHFSDVKPHEERGIKNWRSWFGNRSKTVNLRPPVYKRYPVFAAVTVVLVVGVSFFGLRRLFTRAEVADFYPSTCLGAWAGAQNAQGKPDMIAPASTSTTFSDNNSAIFVSGTGQIFCGGFVPPDYSTAGEVKSVGLTFVWQIGEPAATSSFPVVTEISTSTTESSTAPATSETSTTSFLHNFRNLILSSALAQTDPSASSQTDSAVPPPPPPQPAADTTPPPSEAPPAPVPAPAPEPVNEPVPPATESSTVITAPPLEATLAPIVSSTEQSASTTETSVTLPITEAAVPPPAPDDNFLEISYSIDGHTWVWVAKVNASNWQNFTVTLPVSNWDELGKLQIQIAGIPTTLNPTPKVYLDGMFAEVHYDLPPVFAGVGGGTAPDATNGTVQNTEETPVIVLPPTQKPTPVNPGQNTFKADEAPQFNLDLNSLVAPPPPPPPPADSGE